MTNVTGEVVDASEPRHRAALTGWGIVLIVVGSVAALVIVATLALAVLSVESAVQNGRQRAGVRPANGDVFIGLLPVGLVAAGVIWTGIGCVQRKRWVRPIVLIGTAFVMAYGLLDVVAVLLQLPHAIDVAADPNDYFRGSTRPQASAVIAGFCVHAGAVFAAAIVLPWFLRRLMLRSETAAELDAMDPHPNWTDRCPLSVLGWVAFCVFSAVGLLLRLQHPSLPAFSFILTGTNAIGCLSTFGILMLWGAWLCYRLDRLGLILTSVLVTALHLSIICFLWNGSAAAELNPRSQERNQTRLSNRLEQSQDESEDRVVTVTAVLEAIMIFSLEFVVARGFVVGWHISAVPGSFWAPMDWRHRGAATENHGKKIKLSADE